MPPRSSRWYGMHTDKKDCESSTVCTWSPEPVKLNHSFSRVARRSLPSAPPSRAFSQDMLRHWERASREQTIMCNQAAGLSRCLTRVQDSISSQLKTLHLDMKGKSSERMKQAIDELEYLVTFNRSVSQAMARTMLDLSEGVFINMANFTLARRDSYLEYLHAGVKQDTLNALGTSPGKTHTRALAGLDRQDPVNSVWSGLSGPTVHVPHRSSHSNRKTSPPRATSHEAHTVALEKQLEGPRITRQGDPLSPGPSTPT